MIPICFRFDDPSPVSDHELERKIIGVFRRHAVPLCVAAIPFKKMTGGELIPLTTDNAWHLIEACREGLIEVAQHGHSHVRLNGDRAGAPSEFAGVPADQQVRMIRHGQELLSGLFGMPVRGFVPPWNTYDSATVQALEAAGFEFMSAGWEVLRACRLPIVPRTSGLGEGRAAIQEALLFRSLSPVVVIVFHPDDFEEFRHPPAPGEAIPCFDLDKLDALLAWAKSAEELRTTAISEVATEVSRGTALWHIGELSWHRHLPHRLQRRLPRRILMRAGRHALVKAAILAAAHGLLE